MKLYAMNKLLCEPYKLKNESSNSFIVTAESSGCIAKIISVYEGCEDYREGMIVFCDKEYALEYIIAGKKYLAIDELDVLAIIKEDE